MASVERGARWLLLATLLLAGCFGPANQPPVATPPRPSAAPAPPKPGGAPARKKRPKVLMAALGEQHSLVLREDGTVWAFGLNGNWQTAREVKDRLIDRPELVKELSKVVGVGAGGSSSFAWCEDGKVWGWGFNPQHRLGGAIDGNYPANVSAPIRVQIDNVQALSHDGELTLALMSNGKVWAWGTNRSGQVGTGDRKMVFLPTEIKGLEKVKAIDAGGGHALALTEDGRVWSWGNNSNFQLGDGTRVNAMTPMPVAALTNIVSIATGSEHSLAATRDGLVWAWGSNSVGQLGQGHNREQKMPILVPVLEEIVQVAAAYDYSLALKKDGTVWVWGEGSHNGHQGGKGKSHHLPCSVPGLPKIKTLVAGSGHQFGLTAEGDCWVWGDNSVGQLGMQTPGEYSLKPMRLELPAIRE